VGLWPRLGAWRWRHGRHGLRLLAAILAALIAVVVWFSRSGPLDRSQRRSNGLAVLEQRYARGEISREEYLEKKRDITG
jgi:putative membrane protein